MFQEEIAHGKVQKQKGMWHKVCVAGAHKAEEYNPMRLVRTAGTGMEKALQVTICTESFLVIIYYFHLLRIHTPFIRGHHTKIYP